MTTQESPVASLAQESPVASLAQESPVASLAQESPVASLAQESPVASLAPTTVVGTELAQQEAQPLSDIGYGSEVAHSASCVVVDEEVRSISRLDSGVEILPIADALKQYPWVQDLMFSLIAPDFDDEVREAAETPHHPIGHFIWVKDGYQVELPLQSFTLLATPQQRQFIHNITVIGENSSLTMVSGATVEPNVRTGHHISISETFLRPGARCSSVSIERWGKDMVVNSYAATQIGRGARDETTTIAMSGLRDHRSRSVTYIDADGVSNDQSVYFAPRGTRRVMDQEINLTGDGASAESIARMVTDGGDIVNNTTLRAEGHHVRGYLGCDGLKLTDAGELSTTPGLVARTADAQLSHEASIGMISADRVAYLMASGLAEDTARALIVNGFLELNTDLVPEALRGDIAAMIATAKSGAM